MEMRTFKGVTAYLYVWRVSFKFKCFIYFPAVQEERQRNKEKGEGEVESTSGANNDMPVEKILEAELAVDPNTDTYIDTQVGNKIENEDGECVKETTTRP